MRFKKKPDTPLYFKDETITCSNGHVVGVFTCNVYIGDMVTTSTIVDFYGEPVYKEGDCFVKDCPVCSTGEFVRYIGSGCGLQFHMMRRGWIG